MGNRQACSFIVQIMLSLKEDFQNTDKRPRAVILSSNDHERTKIEEVIRLLTRGWLYYRGPVTKGKMRDKDAVPQKHQPTVREGKSSKRLWNV